MKRSSRSSRRSSADESSQEKPSSEPEAKSASQLVVLLEDSVLQEDPNRDDKPVLCPLRHPKTGNTAMFMFANEDKKVYELIKFKQEFRSWAIGDQIQQDGSFILTTPVDPLFLVLPYFEKVAQFEKYTTLDQTVIDDEYPECSRLHTCSGLDDLLQIADVKGSDDIKAYRFNKDKTLSWLRLKTDILADSLIENRMNLDGSKSSIYARSLKVESIDRDEVLKYSFGLVSDYLSSDLGASLHEYLGIKDDPEPSPAEGPPAKRAKIEPCNPTEDYSKPGGDKKKAKETKLTQAQKKLNKVDKTGMKSMMSFFSPKTKT